MYSPREFKIRTCFFFPRMWLSDSGCRNAEIAALMHVLRVRGVIGPTDLNCELNAGSHTKDGGHTIRIYSYICIHTGQKQRFLVPTESPSQLIRI